MIDLQSLNHNFLPRFARLATVNTLSGIIIPISGLVDVAFLGHLDDLSYLAGVSLSVLIFSYLYRLVDFLKSSTNAVTAQANGADDPELVLATLLRNGLIAIVIGGLILLLQYPIRVLAFHFLVGSPEVKAAAVSYFNFRIWAAPAVLLNFVLFGWLLGKEMNFFVVLLSTVQSIVHISMAYLLILQWDWASAGAGLSTVISQYTVCLIGLFIAAFYTQWNQLSAAISDIFDWEAFRAIFQLNANISVTSLAQISIYAIFINLSSALGSEILAENSVLMEASITVFMLQGIGFAIQSLAGNFKGQEATELFKPLLIVATVVTLSIAVPLTSAYVCFPKTLFGLFTNHDDVLEQISGYVVWLLPFEISQSIGIVFQGYLIGLTESTPLRNATLLGFGLIFLPLTVLAWHAQSNHFLWLAISLFSIIYTLILGIKVVNAWNVPLDESLPASETPN
jgi:MATE family multidrug resistance protein